ncbi:SH3 domain-containing protein [Paracraurococcus lichenis]|uniref:SH3 domain-containing protein n=1 Tax=Paracraurococcus lichenis TaxID=3064888 RepID=A0ABT9E3K5_9PROT|nr:SH3 domain-containing protein [Paracraurococcus sp. LOR1-02]MDO9710738.1 SH3 domain-containing protein [Paracraurococcus sp. LOR1-02]
MRIGFIVVFGVVRALIQAPSPWTVLLPACGRRADGGHAPWECCRRDGRTPSVPGPRVPDRAWLRPGHCLALCGFLAVIGAGPGGGREAAGQGAVGWAILRLAALVAPAAQAAEPASPAPAAGTNSAPPPPAEAAGRGPETRLLDRYTDEVRAMFGQPPIPREQPTPRQAPRPAAAEDRVVPRIAANIRSGPSDTGTILRTAQPGVELRVHGRQGGWVQVGDDAPWGWIHSSLLRPASR